MRTFPTVLAAAIAFALSLSAAVSTTAAGDGATASELKAAFLFNFAKFTEWPPDALRAGQPLELCVADDAAGAAALERIVKGRTIDGRALVTAAVSLKRDLTSCHVLYVGGLDGDASTLLRDTLKTAPMLTVADSDMFVKRGGIAQLIYEHDRMRFVINVAAARRAHLTLSSQLLNLATIVK